MAAVVGFAGLESTLVAARRGAMVALANKEALVCAGRLLIDAIEESGGVLLPVDSEHNAIFQVLEPQPPPCHRPADPDGVRRAVPQLVAGRHGRGHARAGAGPSQLGHGRQDLDRFGDHDEQGPRAHRGAPAVRPAGRADRDRRASAIGDPFDGGLSRRLGAGPARHARHARADQPHARLAVAHRRPRRAAGFHDIWRHSPSNGPIPAAFRRYVWRERLWLWVDLHRPC